MLRPRLIATGLFALTAPAHSAQIVTFTNGAAFVSALKTPSKLEDFSDALLQPGLSITGNRLSYPSGVLRHSINPASAPSLSFTFTDGIGAFGGDFDLTPGGVGQGFDVAVSFVDTARADLLVGSTINASGFIGFTSDAAIRQVRFLPRGGGDETYTFDNLRFAEPIPAMVPEPATWALMMGGFGLVGAAVRRRRFRAADMSSPALGIYPDWQQPAARPLIAEQTYRARNPSARALH